MLGVNCMVLLHEELRDTEFIDRKRHGGCQWLKARGCYELDHDMC